MAAAVPWFGVPRGRLVTLLLASLAMGAVGLVDDIWPVRPPVKLVAQIVLTGVLVQSGPRAPTHQDASGRRLADASLGGGHHQRLQSPRQHGRPRRGHGRHHRRLPARRLPPGGQRAGARPSRPVFSARSRGFLVRNLPPARIFMGDAGSLFLGFFLAGLCLVQDAAYYSRGMMAVLAMPVLLMCIPIFDTTFVTVTRFVSGRRVSQGGRDHTSHRLVALGGQRAAGAGGALRDLGPRRHARAPHVPGRDGAERRAPAHVARGWTHAARASTSPGSR